MKAQGQPPSFGAWQARSRSAIYQPYVAMSGTAQGCGELADARHQAVCRSEPTPDLRDSNNPQHSRPGDTVACRTDPMRRRAHQPAHWSKAARRHGGTPTSAKGLGWLPLLAMMLLVGLPSAVHSQPQPDQPPPPAPLAPPPPRQAPGLRGAVTIGSFIPTSVLAGVSPSRAYVDGRTRSTAEAWVHQLLGMFSTLLHWNWQCRHRKICALELDAHACSAPPSQPVEHSAAHLKRVGLSPVRSITDHGMIKSSRSHCTSYRRWSPMLASWELNESLLTTTEQGVHTPQPGRRCP